MRRQVIGEKETELTLIVPKYNLGKASLRLPRAGPDNDSEVIKMRTASQIANGSQCGWPTVVKIDVEGHEPQVFRSLEPCLISKQCKAIVFENHAPEIDAFNIIKALTERHGYQIYGIKKSLWSTALVRTEQQISYIADYAVLRPDLVAENKRVAKLIA